MKTFAWSRSAPNLASILRLLSAELFPTARTAHTSPTIEKDSRMPFSLRIRITLYILIGFGVVLIPLSAVGYRAILQEFDALADARMVQATRTIDLLAENAVLRNRP